MKQPYIISAKIISILMLYVYNTTLTIYSSAYIIVIENSTDHEIQMQNFDSPLISKPDKNNFLRSIWK